MIQQRVWSTKMPLPNTANLMSGGPYIPVFEIAIPAIAAGQVLSIVGELQVTDNFASLSPLVDTYLDLNGVAIDNAMGGNDTPEEHHKSLSRVYFWQAPEAMTNVVIRLLARGVYDTLNATQVALVIDQPGYGMLQAMVS